MHSLAKSLRQWLLDLASIAQHLLNTPNRSRHYELTAQKKASEEPNLSSLHRTLLNYHFAIVDSVAFGCFSSLEIR